VKSYSMQRTEWWFPGASVQFWIMLLTVITGLLFYGAARWLGEEPLASAEAYGPFVTLAYAEAWALPLVVGPTLALLGQLAELNEDFPILIAQIWRAMGNFITGGVIGLFAYGGLFASTYEPLFIYSAVYFCVHVMLFFIAVNDMRWRLHE